MNSPFTFLLLLFALSASAQSASLSFEVKNADAKLNQLIIEKNAKEAAPFYSDEFILTTSSGKQKRKQDIVSEIVSPALTMEVNETEDVEVRISGNTAVLSGVLHQQGVFDGKPFDVRLRVTDTWIKSESGWKILAGHASLLSKT